MATRAFEPSLQQLRELVLDYLIHNAYIDTARAFASESAAIVHSNEIQEGLAGDVNLETNGKPMEGVTTSGKEEDPELSEPAMELVRRRRDIKVHILSGRPEEATNLLDTYFPAVLREHDMDASPFRKSPPSVSSPFSRLQYTSQLSVKPIHIALNLRILAFIEASRTVPLIYSGDPNRISSVSNGQTRSADENSAHQTALLHHAQRLYATVESLRDTREREIYRKELNAVGGLLAYTVPEKSPIAKYLSQEQREAVANQVNSAILYHMGKPASSHVELYVRQTATVMSIMRDNNVPLSLQMRSVLPDEVVAQQLPPQQAGSSPGKMDKSEKAGQERIQTCPLFSLRQFLDS